MNCECADFEDTVPLDSLLRHVVPIVTVIPHSMALDLIRQAYILFARKSSLVVAELTQDYQAGVRDYPLLPPDGYEVYMVRGLKCPRLNLTWWYELGQFPAWDNRIDVFDNTHILLRDTPSVDDRNGLTVYVSLVPTECVDS